MYKGIIMYSAMIYMYGLRNYQNTSQNRGYVRAFNTSRMNS